MENTEQEQSAPRARKARNVNGETAATGLALEVTQTTFVVNLGAKGDKASWNSHQECDLTALTPDVVTYLVKTGIETIIRGAIKQGATEEEGREAAADRWQELLQGVTAKRRSAASALERKARELAFDMVRAQAHAQKLSIKQEQMQKTADALFEARKDQLLERAAELIKQAEEAAQALGSIDFAALDGPQN